MVAFHIQSVGSDKATFGHGLDQRLGREQEEAKETNKTKAQEVPLRGDLMHVGIVTTLGGCNRSKGRSQYM